MTRKGNKQFFKYVSAYWTICLVLLFIIVAFIAGLFWLSAGIAVLWATYQLLKYGCSRIKTVRLKNFLSTFLLFVYVFIVIAGIKLFLIELYVIPSPSMEKTLLPNDVILVNKLIYGPAMPRSIFEISWVNFLFHQKSKEGDVTRQGPRRRAKGLAPVKQGDVLVFQMHGMGSIVKRCVAVAGDLLTIRDGDVFVGAKKYVSPQVQINRISDTSSGKIRLFADPPNTHWTPDNMGPFIVPEKGMTIDLTPQTWPVYEKVITVYEGTEIVPHENSFFIHGQPVSQYTFKQNYCFLMGDNRAASFDSRYIGFIPEDNITGKAQCILYSTNNNRFRWSRVLKGIL